MKECPRCPYCKENFIRLWVFNYVENDEKTVECESCKKEFIVKVDFKPTYSVRKK